MTFLAVQCELPLVVLISMRVAIRSFLAGRDRGGNISADKQSSICLQGLIVLYVLRFPVEFESAESGWNGKSPALK